MAYSVKLSKLKIQHTSALEMPIYIVQFI